MERIYGNLLREHLRDNRQMALLTGPRQVGKTTLTRLLGAEAGEATYVATYLNWDNADDRQLMLQGVDAVAQRAQLQVLSERPSLLVFDEIHKFPDWKNWIKGFFDTWEGKARLVLTGSARLDLLRLQGDSLMGRYFTFRVHPLSVGELAAMALKLPERERNLASSASQLPVLIRPPHPLPDAEWDALWGHGGFPEPFLKRDVRFSNRWHALREQQMLQEDLRDLTRALEVRQFQLLCDLLRLNASGSLTYSSLAVKLRVSVDTVRRWVALLEALHYCYLVRPWHRNIAKSLVKEPKVYLWDWSLVQDPGARFENMVAGHLLKAVQYWEDLGLGQFALHYLRDRDQREVDFVVVRNGEPWFLVEAKLSEGGSCAPALKYFQQATGAPYAFQVVGKMPYVQADCFAESGPVVVPACTLLSRLP